MATCRECENSEVHVGYWICKCCGEKTIKSIDELIEEGRESCPHFKLLVRNKRN